MLVELATAVALVSGSAVPAAQGYGGLAVLVTIWISTATLQVPAHRRLGLGFEASAARRLVVTNWLRTILWTARGILAAYWLG